MDNKAQLVENAKKNVAEKMLKIDSKAKKLSEIYKIMSELVMHDVVYKDPDNKSEINLKDKADIIKKMKEFEGNPFYEATRDGAYQEMIVSFCISKGIKQEEIINLVNDVDNPQNAKTKEKIQNLRQEYFDLVTGRDYDKIASFYNNYINVTFDDALALVKDTDNIEKLDKNIDKFCTMSGYQSIFVQTLKYKSDSENLPNTQKLIDKINEKMAERGENYDNMIGLYSLFQLSIEKLRIAKNTEDNMSLVSMYSAGLMNTLHIMSDIVKNLDRKDFGTNKGNITDFLATGALLSTMEINKVANSKNAIKALDNIILSLDNPELPLIDIVGEVYNIDNVSNKENDFLRISDSTEYERIFNMTDEEFVNEMDKLDKEGKPYNASVCSRYLKDNSGKTVNQDDPRYNKYLVCENINNQKMFLALPPIVVIDKLLEKSNKEGISAFSNPLYTDALEIYKNTPFADILGRITYYKAYSLEGLNAKVNIINMDDLEKIVGDKIISGPDVGNPDKKYVVPQKYMNLCKEQDGKAVPIFKNGKEYSEAEIKALINGAYENNGKLLYFDGQNVYPNEIRKGSLCFVKNAKVTTKKELAITNEILENRDKIKLSEEAFDKVKNQSRAEILEYFQECVENKWLLSMNEINFLMTSNKSPFSDDEKNIINGYVNHPEQMTKVSSLGALVAGSIFYTKNSIYMDNSFIKNLAEKYNMNEKEMYNVFDMEKGYKPTKAYDKKLKYLNEKEKERAKAPEEIKEFISINDEVRVYNSDFKKANDIMVRMMCDGGYFVDPEGNKQEYHSLDEFDKLHDKYFHGKPFQEATRQGVEPTMMRFFLSSKGIDAKAFMSLANDPESELAKNTRKTIENCRQEYADFVSKNDHEVISEVYKNAVKNYSKDAVRILNSYDSLKNTSKNYTDMLFYSGAQSVLLQTFNIGNGGNVDSKDILDKVEEKLAKENINFQNVSDTLYSIEYYTQSFNKINSGFLGHPKFQNLEDYREKINDIAHLSMFINSKYHGTDLNMINKISNAYSDTMNFAQSISTIDEFGEDRVQRYNDRIKDYIWGGDRTGFYMFAPSDYSKFVVDAEIKEFEYKCQNSLPEVDNKLRISENIQSERVAGVQIDKKINSMNDKEFRENIQAGTNEYRLFNPAEVDRYKKENPNYNAKAYDTMSFTEQNMAASEFLLKNIMFITGSEEVAVSFYDSLKNPDDKKLFVRAINLGIEDEVLRESLGGLCAGKFNSQCLEDMKYCIDKEIQIGGASALFRKIKTNPTLDNMADYLNKRYGASTESGKFRLNIVKRYSEVISELDKIPCYIAEIENVKEGRKSPEYQAFYDAAAEYITFISNDSRKYEKLEQLKKAAGDYIAVKGELSEKTDIVQRRYDLAKDMLKYAEIEQKKMDLSEIKRYDEAMRKGMDVSKMGFAERTPFIYKLSRAYLVQRGTSPADLYNNTYNETLYYLACKKAAAAYDSFIKNKNSAYINKAIEEAESFFCEYDKRDLNKNTFAKDYISIRDKEGFIKYYNDIRKDIVDISHEKSGFTSDSAKEKHSKFMEKYKFDSEKEKYTEKFANYINNSSGIDISKKGQLKDIYIMKGEEKIPLIKDDEQLSESQIYERMMMTSRESTVYVESQGQAFPQIYGYDKSRGDIVLHKETNPNEKLRKDPELLANEINLIRQNKNKVKMQQMANSIGVSETAYTNADNLLKPNPVIDKNIPNKDLLDVKYENETNLSEDDCIIIALGAAVSAKANKGKQISSSSTYQKSNDEYATLQNQRVMIMDNIFVQKEYARHKGGLEAIAEGRKMAGHAILEYKNGNKSEVVKYLNSALETLKEEMVAVVAYDGMRANMMNKMAKRLEEIASKPEFKDEFTINEGTKQFFRLFSSKIDIHNELNNPGKQLCELIGNNIGYTEENIAEFVGLRRMIIDYNTKNNADSEEIKNKIKEELKKSSDKEISEFDLVMKTEAEYTKQRSEGKITLPMEQRVLGDLGNLKKEYIENAKNDPLFGLCKNMKPVEFRDYIIDSVSTAKNGYGATEVEYMKYKALSFEGKRAYLEYLDANNTEVNPFYIMDFQKTMVDNLPDEIKNAYKKFELEKDLTEYNKLPSYIKNVIKSDIYNHNVDNINVTKDIQYNKSVLEKMGVDVKSPAIDDLLKTKYEKISDRMRESTLNKLADTYKEKDEYLSFDIGGTQTLAEFLDSQKSIRSELEAVIGADFLNNICVKPSDKDMAEVEKRMKKLFMPTKLDKDGKEILDEEALELHLDILSEYQRDMRLQHGQEIMEYRDKLKEQYGENRDIKGRDVNYEIAKQYATHGKGKYKSDCVSDLLRNVFMNLDYKIVKDEDKYRDTIMNGLMTRLSKYKETFTGKDKEAYEAAFDDKIHLSPDAKGYDEEKVDIITRASRDSYIAEIRGKWHDMPDIEKIVKLGDEHTARLEEKDALEKAKRKYDKAVERFANREVLTKEELRGIPNPDSKELKEISAAGFDEVINKYMPAKIKEKAKGDEIFNYIKIKGIPINDIYPNASSEEKKKLFMNAISVFKTVKKSELDSDGKIKSNNIGSEELNNNDNTKNYISRYEECVINNNKDKKREDAEKVEAKNEVDKREEKQVSPAKEEKMNAHALEDEEIKDNKIKSEKTKSKNNTKKVEISDERNGEKINFNELQGKKEELTSKHSVQNFKNEKLFEK